MLDQKIFIDMDGTLCGHSKWDGFISNTISLFTTGILLYPPENKEWSILTARPKIDFPIIKLVCKNYKFTPSHIITSSLFYKFKTVEAAVVWKIKILRSYLNPRTEVIYIDLDKKILSIMKGYNLNGIIVCATYDELNK